MERRIIIWLTHLSLPSEGVYQCLILSLTQSVGQEFRFSPHKASVVLGGPRKETTWKMGQEVVGWS